MRLFVSYSRKDEFFARRLAHSLSQLGADVWIDIEDIPAGLRWSSAVQQGLDVCNAMIVLISPNSMASRNVEDEWQYYLDQNKPVIPVLLRPSKIHYQLTRIQYIDFYRADYETALHRLQTALGDKGLDLDPFIEPTRPMLVVKQVIQPAPRPVRRRVLLGLIVAVVFVLMLVLTIKSGGLDNLLSYFGAHPDTEVTTPTERAVSSVPPTTIAAALPTEIAASPLPPMTIVPTRSVTIISAVNLRRGPGRNFAFVSVAPTNAVLPVVARNDEATWFLVVAPDSDLLWVSSSFVTMSDSAWGLPVVNPSSTLTIASNAPLYASIEDVSPIVGTAEAGQTLYLTGESHTDNAGLWYRLLLPNGEQGWLRVNRTED